jgi:iron complex transport system substrate-binding protein
LSKNTRSALALKEKGLRPARTRRSHGRLFSIGLKEASYRRAEGGVSTEISIHPFVEADAPQVRALFIAVNCLLAPPDLRDALKAYISRPLAGAIIRTVGARVGASERAFHLVSTLETCLADARSRAEQLPKRPRVFFEEWDDPLISAIGWVSELIEIAGGVDIFADRAVQGAGKDRVVTKEEVVTREPELIIGSWCGKKCRPERVMARPGFDRTPAVQRQDVYEIKSPLILQPGPAALTDGFAELQNITQGWACTMAGLRPKIARSAPVG